MVCLAEYIWIDGNQNLRSKTRVINTFDIKSIDEIENWNYDGSSTNQAKTENSEVILKPCAMYRDPFRSKNDKLILCDTYSIENIPLSTNTRHNANKIFQSDENGNDPWFGLEQEYFIIDPRTGLPLGYHSNIEQGQYYCGIGYWNAFGRNMVEEHLQLCLKAKLNISGINAEVAPGQWEFQIGPCVGIDQGDQLWIARYILSKLTEKYNVYISYDPKFLPNINGSGCHINFSTKYMRHGTENKKGIEYIEEAIDKLSVKHEEHMCMYGINNEQRMTGEHETADYNVFSFGYGDRGTSIRIGNETIKNEKGYFEDRRPGANIDPYIVTSELFKTICLV